MILRPPVVLYAVTCKYIRKIRGLSSTKSTGYNPDFCHSVTSVTIEDNCDKSLDLGGRLNYNITLGSITVGYLRDRFLIL
jgi:hypothetical protein